MDTHMQKELFSGRRFKQLLLRDIASSYRGILIAIAAVGGSVILIAILKALGPSSGQGLPNAAWFYFEFYKLILFSGGLIVSSLAFREAQQGSTGIFYLTIPSSALEKLTAKILATSLGFAAGSLVVMTAMAAMSEGILRLIYGFGLGMFNPIDRQVLLMIAYYLIFQSVFVAGSLWFKKFAFLKTVMWMAIFGIGAVIVALITARILRPDYFTWQPVGDGGTGWTIAKDLTPEYLKGLFAPGTPAYRGLQVFITVGKAMLYASAPLCWLASYFKLKEIEV